ncbi:MAG: mannonate dehydratase [Armatimonadetes bacterium]|nr:mannonate dehydratase [Planctomycetota bacterium]MBI2201592.1 mannonate dehydratase [Armatimonadota bacterium]
MKLGLGLYPSILTDDNLKFARQLSVTHIVAWMPLPVGNGVWEFADLLRLKKYINSFGLELDALENFQPAHWDKILLDRPGKEAQMENLKATIRNLGKVGIPIMGYYFSLAGVWGHWRSGSNNSAGRGGAGLTSFDYDLVKDAPLIPKGEAWCGWKVEADPEPGTIGEVAHAEMWERLRYFLESLVPVAEEAGVRLAAHPDDPPVPVLRGTARLLTCHENYRRLIEMKPSPSNALEFCQGTVAEMGQDTYEAIRYFGSRKKIAYVHFRNVRGDFPNRFDEVFIDEGDVDMVLAMRAYLEVGYDGVLIPDHSPHVTCQSPWHAGMAYALGYMRACMQFLGVK